MPLELGVVLASVLGADSRYDKLTNDRTQYRT